MQQDQTNEVEIRWGVKIALRDAVRLNATVYLPKNGTLAVPSIVTMTPYISDSCHARGMFFAAHGFSFVIVDVRGRGNSEGIFRPNIQEADDGYDVVQWLAQQSFCSGKVSMWGGSYLGYAQWATAKRCPPNLVSIVPTAAPYIGVDFPMRNNIWYPYLVQWFTLITGRASQKTLFSDNKFWSEQFRRWHESGRAFAEVDSAVGNPCPTFQEWLAHPERDGYWASFNPTPQEYACISSPILTITGSYDDDQPGALEHYRNHIRHASEDARSRHYLIIGPWDHAGTGSPVAEFGGLQFSPASALDMNQLLAQWYAWIMRDGAKPEFLKDRVAYYVMGAERWRYANTLENVTASYQSFYLASRGNAAEVFSSGLLSLEKESGQPDSFTYDPREPGREIGAEARLDSGSFTDQSLVMALSGRALFYHSAPFKEDVEVSGFFRLNAWIAIDCPDTDFYVSIYEITDSGSSILLSTDAMRARYREGLSAPKLVVTDQPLLYEFHRFTFTSREIKRGHRLRLVIAPVGRVVYANFWQKNYNAGGEVSQEAAEQGRAVTVRMFHDADHPSVLHVPLGTADGQL